MAEIINNYRTDLNYIPAAGKNKIKVVAIVNKFLENDMKEIGVLILAAGESKRMGKSKQYFHGGAIIF